MVRVSFLGYPVDNSTMEEILYWIKDSVKKRNPRIIAVTNANKLWQAHDNSDLSFFVKTADLIIPEYAVVWGAKKLGIGLHHVGGIMLLKSFLPFAEKNGLRPYFLGAKPEVLQRMIARIRQQYPRLNISGYHHGYLNDADVKEAALRDIKKNNPDVLFIAMGSPKQEYLMSELKGSLNVPVLMGVGGSFDVISGDKDDAPPWARSKGLEWVYRISQDPLDMSYWKRYIITNAWFVWRVAREYMGLRNDT